ncbi:ATPase [Reichenbachiella agariperforans]|nr:ATPase [Reichenbachiella agariperforans]
MKFNNQNFGSPRATRSRLVKRVPFILSLIATVLLIFDFGFDQSSEIAADLLWFYTFTLIITVASMVYRYISATDRPPAKVWPYDGVLIAFLLTILANFLLGLHMIGLNTVEWFVLSILVSLVREFSALRIDFKVQHFNPAQLFIISFVVIVLLGMVMLLLPNATHDGISVIDALFTATSAVCVTGLIVVDTGSYFTHFGQFVIIGLIQIGGLGIMTFTSYFSYFFRGSSSYETQLLLRDMTNSEKIAEVFNTLKKIILITVLIELLGAVFIFISLDSTVIPSLSQQIFFSVFHSISAFCNAGFSTLASSLYDIDYRYNYPMHLSIAMLFILGGIGFPIIFNLYKYLKHLVIHRLMHLGDKEKMIFNPWMINLNTRIVVITTLLLIVTGTIVFYGFEYNNTLKEHQGLGKLVTAFFGAVTPRTAGFNSVDMTAMHFSTILFTFMLMWIGASPGSTGGGIKTSTIAIATLNYLSIAKGKNRIELFNREIAEISVRRAFALISLSLVVIGTAIVLMAAFDPDQHLLGLGFECFSAYSTVGLSLGITASLSTASKFVLIATMFIGRVSMLTLLIAIMRKIKHLNYRYPTEEILIN